jgi:hypothetical protein
MRSRAGGIALSGALVVLLGGCGIGDTLPRPTATASAKTPLATLAATPLASITPVNFASCPKMNEYVLIRSGYEAQGIIRTAPGAVADGQLWVNFQYLTYAHYGQTDYAAGKFVWRMTGHGDFHVLALGPHGEQLLPKAGPDAHLGSSWDTHPGSEWGTGMTFSSAGCWDLYAWRDDIAGDVALRIEQR